MTLALKEADLGRSMCVFMPMCSIKMTDNFVCFTELNHSYSRRSLQLIFIVILVGGSVSPLSELHVYHPPVNVHIDKSILSFHRHGFPES